MSSRQILWVGWGIVFAGAAYISISATEELTEGRWTARLAGDRVRLELRLDPLPWGSRIRFDLDLADLEGLGAPDFESASGPVRFRMARDAGTIVFEGQGGRRPSGTYVFEPNPEFVRELSRVGDPFPEDGDLFRLAIDEVSIDVVRGLGAMGYDDLDAHDLVRIIQHGIDLAYIEAMQQLGFRPEIEEIIRLWVHGVSAATVARYRELGLTGIPVESLVRLEIHGVDPGWVRGMADAGIGTSDVEDLIRLRTHGIEPSMVAEARDSGFRALSIEELIRLSIHGIPVSYLRAACEAGLRDADFDDIVSLHNNGVEPSFLVGMAALGYGSEDEIVRLHANGVPVATAQELHEIGYTELSVDDLVRLQANGVTPGFVRRLAEAGHDDLSADELVRISVSGVEQALTAD
jgi:hypothetical protein